MQGRFDFDPANIEEDELRDYFLFVKLKKQWKPKTIRQTLAAAKMFRTGQDIGVVGRDKISRDDHGEFTQTGPQQLPGLVAIADELEEEPAIMQRWVRW